MMHSVSFISELVGKMPKLRAMLEKHVADNRELLPHVFMGDVSRYAIEQHHELLRGSSEARISLMLLFSTAETAAREGDEDLKELISVSFLENIAEEIADQPEFLSFLGPSLNRELEPIFRSFGY